MMNQQEVAEMLVGAGVVKTNFEKPFLWTSGIESPLYCDARILIGLPGQRGDLVKALIDKTKKLNEAPHAVAGTATAGIPWAAWVADHMGLPMLYVRKKPKGHGGGKQVEGCVSDSCRKILVVEDAVSTGGSSLDAVKAIRREYSAQVTDVVCLFSWDLPRSKDVETENDIRFHPLTTFGFITQALLDLGQVDAAQKAILDDFHAGL